MSTEHTTAYDCVADATRGLLAEVVTTLEHVSEPFVIIGGWSPVLLNSSPIAHPGTRDVDVLFANGATRFELEHACTALLAVGYLPSAKHPFQLIRTLSVGTRQLAFNVDLLHPDVDATDDLQHEMFVDQLDLGLPLTAALPETMLVRSIVTPKISFVFDDSRWLTVSTSAMLPDGTQRSISVPVIDELALIVSKCESVRSVKRDRDAFDIALAVTQARDPDQLRVDTLTLAQTRPVTFALLANLRSEIASTRRSFVKRLRAFVPASAPPDTATAMFDALVQYLNDVSAP